MPIVDGTVIKQVFNLINSNPVAKSLVEPTIEQIQKGCCFGMPALAQTTPTSDLKNDVHSPYFVWNNAFSSAIMVLEKYENSVWGSVATLNDDTYGTFNAFGFFTTIYNESAIGYKIEWTKVLNLQGEGRYRVRCQSTPFIGNPVNQLSLEFCLSEYTDARANETVRLEWWLNGNIGDHNNDTLKIDYGTLNWYSELRLPKSMFGNDKSSEHEKTFVKYQNGQKIWTGDSQVESYTLRTGKFPSEIHKFIKVNILQADTISVTDYNSLNPNTHVNKFVTWVGTYEPNYVNGALKTSVETDFEQAVQNFNHKRC